MRFTPKTADEIASERLLPDGEYDFEVTQVVETVSTKGNDMLKVFLRVFKPDGSFVLVTDYLMESIMYKLLHFCEATGCEELYHSGMIKGDDSGTVNEFTGKQGRLKLGTQKSADYPDKNTVKDYIAANKGAAKAKRPTVKQMSAAAQAPVKDDMADDIPW